MPSRGVTLVELVVALALLGLLLGMSGLAIGSLKTPREAELVRELERARAEAVRTGRSVRIEQIVFLPDGRAIGLGVDPLTGAPRARH